MKYADIIIPRGASNTTAINFVVDNLKLRLREMGVIRKTPRNDQQKKLSVINFPTIDTEIEFAEYKDSIHYI
jgi:hypothetical protein